MNLACCRLSPLPTPFTCPFRIMCITSYPCNVRHAVSKEKKPIPGLMSRLMRAMILFDQIAPVLHLPQFHVMRQDSSGFELRNSFGVGGIFIQHSSHEELMRWREQPKTLVRPSALRADTPE